MSAYDHRRRQEEEMTRLGYYGLIPFWFGAVAVWIAPMLAPASVFSLQMHSMVLAYGAVIAAYMAGVGAGGLLVGERQLQDYFLPGMIAALAAFVAAWNNLPFGLAIPAAWRHALILIVLIYLLLRDLRAVAAGNLPAWYGALRLRLTFWAGLAILAVIAKLISSGFY